MKVGFSLSLCVQDIIEGRVPGDDVFLIVANTAARTPEGWERVIAEYRESCWQRNPDEGERITRDWLARGLIHQPRLDGNPPHSIAGGHWREFGISNASGRFLAGKEEG